VETGCPRFVVGSSYDEFAYVCQQVRQKLGLRQPKRVRTLPHLLTADELDRFFSAVRSGGHVQHEIMLQLLFFTAMRVGELVKLEVGDVDGESCKIFVDQGKGSKDRYLLFPRSFALVLRAHIAAHPRNRFLFETQRCTGYTVRRVQQIVQGYREKAGLSEGVHPHLFRHQMLTFLTGQKLSDAQIQLLSGHASKKSLEVYQHLSLEAVEGSYQGAVKLLGV
jgi:integrase/recombinase XerD